VALKDAIRRNFDLSVDAYEAYEDRTGRFRTLARLLWTELARVADSNPARVLDAGAGSGASTRVLRERAPGVVALDASREMLRGNDVSDRVQADFDHLPFADGAFDAVAFTASLFLVPDPGVAARDAGRVCRAGGVVGAVAPLGWVDDDGRDAFAALDRDSRSPVGAEAVETALADACGAVETGTWRFATAAADVRRFHRIPAMAARLYPKSTPEERVRRAGELLDALEGTFEQRWRWVVGVVE
jgi:cyclopropane-fatty-acyl-phospholipid synthase